jgi:hypothetical protein
MKTSIFLFLFSFFFASIAQDNYNCFTILSGKDASKDGSVFLAHNEDDSGKQFVNVHKTRNIYSAGYTTVKLKRGGTLDLDTELLSVLWLEMPGMEFSDSYQNEYGVTIVSDACPSREEKAELTDGGIGYWLRRAMALQAKTAREAVLIGGALVEQYGYASSGRTYSIADTSEAWMLSVVNGKHWIAQRIPSDEVAIIPNYYTIGKVNLKDTNNFLASKDIISYARERDWFNGKDAEFNFRETYAKPYTLTDAVNLERHWFAINQLSEKQYVINKTFPFSFKASKKLVLQDLFKILRSHYEGSTYDKSESYSLGSPHKTHRGICANSTQYAMVAQLRSSLPLEIGVVSWISFYHPCIHPFTPWYNGMLTTPNSFHNEMNPEIALEKHFEKQSPIPEHFFLKLEADGEEFDLSYQQNYKSIGSKLKLETELLQAQGNTENNFLKIYARDVNQCKEIITEFSSLQVSK